MAHVAVIGGGIVGAATLEALSRAAPQWNLTLIEKEPELAAHQSGRNSGVIHSGIYYQPGSLKARFCRQGVELLEQFCREHGIRFERRGKLVSANTSAQRGRLADLVERGRANGVRCQLLSAKEARGIEPRLVSKGAVEVPDTGIVDYTLVTKKLVEIAEKSGAAIHTNTDLLAIELSQDNVQLITNQGQLLVDGYINCAGLHSDRVARAAGLNLNTRIVPFRGEYYRLKPAAAAGLSGRLIYPMPDPRFPFLGVHLTPTMGDGFLCGPNAVLALSREGYGWGNLDPRYLVGLVTDRAFIRLALKYWRYGLSEMLRSLSRSRFAESVGTLIKGVVEGDLEPAASGVRAQLVSRHGELIDDFLIEPSARGLHVLNAPSPAATASLRIGKELAERAMAAFG